MRNRARIRCGGQTPQSLRQPRYLRAAALARLEQIRARHAPFAARHNRLKQFLRIWKPLVLEADDISIEFAAGPVKSIDLFLARIGDFFRAEFCRGTHGASDFDFHQLVNHAQGRRIDGIHQRRAHAESVERRAFG